MSRERRVAETFRRMAAQVAAARQTLTSATAGHNRAEAALLVTQLGALVAELGETAVAVQTAVGWVTQDEDVHVVLAEAAEALSRHGRNLRDTGPHIATLLAILGDEPPW